MFSKVFGENIATSKLTDVVYIIYQQTLNYLDFTWVTIDKKTMKEKL